MKHNPVTSANALALTMGIFYVACRILVGLFPGLMFSIAQSWFHDIKLTQLDSASLTMPVFFLGLLSSVFFAWVVGYTYGYICKLMKSS